MNLHCTKLSSGLLELWLVVCSLSTSRTSIDDLHGKSTIPRLQKTVDIWAWFGHNARAISEIGHEKGVS